MPSSQLMTTALVKIYDVDNKFIFGRALLDTCSSANFITENFVNKLRITKRKCSIPVGALDKLSTVTKHIVQLTFKSIHNAFEKTITCLTVPEISNSVPSEFVKCDKLKIPKNLPLADPNFNKPAPIDLLIGSGPTLSMFCIGQIDLSGQDKDLYALKTRLGWIIGGTPNDKVPKAQFNCHLVDLQQDIKKFWEIEEGLDSSYLSAEELACEKHFQQYVIRDESGRYVVALPFKPDRENLGESYPRALKRFKSLIYKLDKNPDLKDRYTDVINEYLLLNHMTEVKNVDTKEGFYLPHHAVIKESSLFTKIRVVFDGSAKTTSGSSLNDQLMVGPTIQTDIITLILRFRLYKYVITADIEKMYRQVLVRPEDRKYQRLLWGTSDEIKTYELNTVSFGLACAPFLAIRCLYQLAEDEGHNFPKASIVLKNDLYVDNLLTGADTIEEAKKIRDELTSLLNLGGFPLRQWGANDSLILEGIDKENVIPNFSLDKNQPVKTLGIVWDAKSDCINYTTKQINVENAISKRIILSEIAKIFDPLGLLGPIILYAKRIMQTLWQLKLEWDESVPNSIYTSWMEFCNQLAFVNNLSFERKVLIEDAINIQLHGFCDACENGYGACIYIRTIDLTGKIKSNLFYAKSRVAPLKTVTLPRLELCGAQLLARITSQIKKILNIPIDKIILWTDSTIVLHWINTSAHLLKTFVANRVSDIQGQSNSNQWRHVRTNDNPADALSRGQLPAEFVKNKQWFHGPPWLIQSEATWPSFAIKPLDELPESKKFACLVTTSVGYDICSLFSSYFKLKRVIAYCMRFKLHKIFQGSLQIEELDNAEKIIVKIVQNSEFANELSRLKLGKSEVSKTSRLLPLNPFLDKDGILRVGGRLKNSDLSYAQKHPILLPSSHYVTSLIIINYHEQNYHAGILTTLYAVRRKFWIIDGRNQVRKIIRKCVKCFRVNPSTTEYIMGNLPSMRLSQSRPFFNVGIDYCGPFYIKEKKFRNRARVKVYVVVFVCLVIKAIHLEVVSDMSSDGFIAALKRFVARRGKPLNIYSDNGKNFVGAKNELLELYALLNSEDHQKRCDRVCTDEGIKWHFIPPLSPHFGGIWESAVKAFKHHLKRVITDQLFTFEEFNTFVIEVEGILNSRPLTPISSDPNDLLVLTPGHFIIGDALTSLPEADFSQIKTNRLSNWQHIQKVKRHFWNRWSKEYLNNLNVRSKWTSGNHNITEGSIVVLKENNLPPMQWMLGRVTKTYPGEDNIIRTVTVKTAKGEYKRNVKGLSLLPISDNNCN